MENLEELLEESCKESSLITEASTDIVVTKIVDEEETEVKPLNPRDEALKILSEYEAKDKEINNKSLDIELKKKQIKEQCPELFKELEDLELEKANLENELKSIKDEATPLFREAYKLDADNKTLLYGKVQGTYVDYSTKHQFDLAAFIAEQHEFYQEHLSYFDPYSKITSVSDYVKFTVKKK